MRGCATQFVNQLNEQEIYTLNHLERVGFKYQFIGGQLREFVYKCREQQTTEGLDQMVAFAFNAQQHSPRYGGANEQLPPGDYVGVIVNTEPVNTTDAAGQIKGGYLALTLTPTEGPLAGQKHIDRLNLHHTNPKTVEIANEQMSAYCHVLGVFNVQDTVQLHNIPFRFTIGWQKGQEPSQERPNGGFTEVKAIYDINGNAPGKAGSGPQPAQPQAPATPPPAGVQPASAPPAAPAQAPGAWGGAPAAAPAAPAAPAATPPQAWGNAPAQAPAAAPTAAPAPAGPGPWGGPQPGQQPPAATGWGQPQQ